jgi:predicted Zn-dependent protease
MSLPVRVAVIAAAAVALAWFVLGIHQSNDLSAASAIASEPHPTAAQAHHANALLDSAGTLNPDQTVAITRAQLALARGDDAQARSILQRVVRAEPQNLTAWIGLERAAGNDRHEREVAFAHAVLLSHTSLKAFGG